MTATSRYPGAFFISLLLHSLALGLIFFFVYIVHDQLPPAKVFEVVAGPGDNFAATAAPALGGPDAIKVEVPAAPPAPIVAPPEPQPIVTPPVAVAEPVPSYTPPVAQVPVPVPVTPTPKPVDISKMIKRKVVVADVRAKKEVEKEKAAERKRMSIEEFKKEHPTTTKTGTAQVAKLDPEGIKNGVVGGSHENKIGGAGGKALTRDDGPVMDAYFAMLQSRLRTALEKPPGLSDTLVTVVEVRVGADGTLSGAHISKSSGNDEFDRASLAAVAAVHMPVRPDGKSDLVSIPFRMKEQDQG